MLNRAIAIAACTLLVAPVTHAAIVDGSFAGTITSGTDQSGIFGPPNTDLTNAAISGTIRYDTALFSQAISGTTNTATAIGPGALTVIVTINGISHNFIDQSSAGIYLDTSLSEITLQNANSRSAGAVGVDESFYLDASDPITPFVLTTSLAQNFSAMPLSSNDSFSIADSSPDTVANGYFVLSSLSLTVPEPASVSLLLVGVLGLVVVRRHLGQNTRNARI